jgi:hypothetical protein
MYFSSNEDLYKYLLYLISILNERDRGDLSEIIEFASTQAESSAAEFLGESRIALKEVLLKSGSILNEKEKIDLTGALAQIRNALERHGRS